MIYLAGLESREQFIGRDIDQHNFICFIKHGIGQRFGNADSRDATDHIVQALQMLHIDGRKDIDACAQQFIDVLPAFRMTRAGRIRVRQFIHQDQCGMPREGGVDIEFTDRLAPMINGL